MLKRWVSVLAVALATVLFSFGLGTTTVRAADDVYAEGGLHIHGVEWVVGKFHRQDNRVHPYGSPHYWRPYVMPESLADNVAVTVYNDDGSYSIHFKTLEDLLRGVVALVRKTKMKVSTFELESHGLPGRLWMPMDRATLQGSGCAEWRAVADTNDTESYNGYYTMPSKAEVEQQHALGESRTQFDCTVTLDSWRKVVNRIDPDHGNLSKYFSAKAEVNLFACLLGYGTEGARLTKGVADLLLPKTGTALVRSGMKYGVGDWSLPLGLRFWDYISDEQLARDTVVYVEQKNDSLVSQNGDVRIAAAREGGFKVGIAPNQEYLNTARAEDATYLEQLNEALDAETVVIGKGIVDFGDATFSSPTAEATSTPEIGAAQPLVRIPGTRVLLRAKH